LKNIKKFWSNPTTATTSLATSFILYLCVLAFAEFRSASSIPFKDKETKARVEIQHKISDGGKKKDKARTKVQDKDKDTRLDETRQDKPRQPNATQHNPTQD
jgi:hypothetical protein